MRLDDETVTLYRMARNYYLAHQGGIPNALERADEIYRELRMRYGVELYYEVDLPENLLLVHPLGTVLGRATYADFFCAYQNVGVGSDLDGNRPVFKGPCVMFPGSKVLGRVTIGANVFITANTVISGANDLPVEVPDNCVVFNMPWYPRIGVDPLGDLPRIYPASKPTKRSVIRDVFKVPLA